MKKKITLIVPIILCMAFTILPENKTLIYWTSGVKLEWKDFQGTPEQNTVELAATDYSVSYSMHAFSDGLRITLKTAFNKQSSWTRDTTDKFLLIHEIGHFNLAEVYARKMRRELLSVNFKYDSVSQQFNKVYTKYYALLNNEQDAYDFITNFSNNHLSQKIWTARIDSMVQSMDDYKDTVLHVKIY
jgi:hypothetical protein